MSKSGTAITLVLLTAASTGFIGYKAVHTLPDPAFPAFDDDTVADFDDGSSGMPTTYPSTRPAGSNSSHGYYDYYRTHHYYSSGFSGSSSTSPGGGVSRGFSSHGTSRGGFGSTGHAMGHSGS